MRFVHRLEDGQWGLSLSLVSWMDSFYLLNLTFALDRDYDNDTGHNSLWAGLAYSTTQKAALCSSREEVEDYRPEKRWHAAEEGDCD